jgi:hypothetical protein
MPSIERKTTGCTLRPSTNPKTEQEVFDSIVEEFMPVFCETEFLKHVAIDNLAKLGLRVLIVDDCRDYALSLGLICRLWGHPTECRFDGASALFAAQWFDPQIFLIDVAIRT